MDTTAPARRIRRVADALLTFGCSREAKWWCEAAISPAFSNARLQREGGASGSNDLGLAARAAVLTNDRVVRTDTAERIRDWLAADDVGLRDDDERLPLLTAVTGITLGSQDIGTHLDHYCRSLQASEIGDFVPALLDAGDHLGFTPRSFYRTSRSTATPKGSALAGIR